MRIRTVCLLLAILLLFSVSGCSREAIAENNERLQELGQEFINDLGNNYLPLKDTPVELARYHPMAVSTYNASYNVGLLQRFAEQQQAGENCSVTMAFTSSSTVISRVVWEDGVGYYLRYQYDESKDDGEMLELTSRYYGTTQFTVNNTATSATLRLYAGKTEVAQFSFRNLVVSTVQNSEKDEDN